MVGTLMPYGHATNYSRHMAAFFFFYALWLKTLNVHGANFNRPTWQEAKPLCLMA